MDDLSFSERLCVLTAVRTYGDSLAKDLAQCRPDSESATYFQAQLEESREVYAKLLKDSLE